MVALMDVMTRHFEVTHPDASLKEVETRMTSLNLSMLPVCEGSKVVGILEETVLREKLRSLDRDPARVKVREIMGSVVLTGTVHQELREVVARMRKMQVPVLPVLDRDEMLVGVYSLGGPWNRVRRTR